MKKRVLTVVALLAVFVAALAGFSIILNRGTDDMTADMGSAKLPVIFFEESGYSLNPLSGYKEEMDIPLMRDDILPVSVGTSVTADINGYAGKISSLTYDIMTLDGKETLKSETLKDISDTVKLELGDSISDGGEKMLRITLVTENEEKIYYYMRVVRAAEFNVQQCMEFAEYFHNTALSSEGLTELTEYYSAEGAPEGNGLQKVTLASDIETIGWRDLAPKVSGNVVWEIKESNQTYTSIVLKYQVKAAGNSKSEDRYNVTEFFKVRFLKGKASLEVYERTMHEVFEGKEKNFSKSGLVLGLREDEVDFLTDEDGDHVSFVQEREVWHYDKKENRISLLFSFADAESDDIRNYKDDHAVRLLDMDSKGNTVFAVYGYMNRGEHEGQTGAAIYYYDIANNYVQEKAFISSRKSGEIVEQRLSRLLHYNKSSDALYAMFEGTLYQVNLKTQEKEVLKAQLSDGQYVSSFNGRYVAYQKSGDLGSADSMEVWDLEKETSFLVEVPEEELIRPLGFVKGDVVYGVGRESDRGINAAGEEIVPLYKVEIRNEKNEVVKSYEAEGIYIEGAVVEENLITLNRVKQDNGVYQATTQDSITNNEGKKEKAIQAEQIASEGKGFQVRLTSKKRMEDQNPKLLKPKQMLYERATTIEFENRASVGEYYVYGLGMLQGIYDQAGEAIMEADKVRGVVVTKEQTKLWERGNRMLAHQIDGLSAFTANAGESTLAACLRQLLAFEGETVDVMTELAGGQSVLDVIGDNSGEEALDLTGCSPEQLCYIIGKGTPVVAMTGGNQAVLLVGYDHTTFTYLDPASGKKQSVTESALQNMTAGSQGAYFGYVK